MCIQPDVEKYVEMISTVFDVQIDCADENKIRVAGTGRFNRQVGKPLHSGRVFSKVMETGEIMVVKDPQNDPICQGCINQPLCRKQCEVCFPIKLEEEVLGAICIASSNEQQYQMILDNLEKLTLFMTNITAFIALKAQEYKDRRIKKYHIDLQDKLINLIRAGVMIMDASGMIVYMNKYCENVIGCSCRSLPYLVKIKHFSIIQKNRKENGEAEYLIRIHSKQLRLQGNVSNIEGINEGEVNTVFIFSEIHLSADEFMEDNDPNKYTFSRVIGNSPLWLAAVERCKQEALTGEPVLLLGEDGTQKESLAKMIHNESIRHANHFIRISYHTPLERLLEKQGFDMDVSKNKLLDGNTVYVEDVGNLSLADQKILLEIIGSSRFTNTKVICATGKELEGARFMGSFYPELLTELENRVIRIPALRTRGKDVLLYADTYLKRYNEQYNKHLRFSKEFRNLMLNYSWKGNIQELKNMISYIVEQSADSDAEISLDTVPDFIAEKFRNDKKDIYNLENAEKTLILKALNDFGAATRSKTRVAKELGISNATLYRKLKEYGIQENKLFE